jgi:hypothetical protein
MPLWATHGGHLRFSALVTYTLNASRHDIPMYATLMLLDVQVDQPGQMLLFAFGSDDMGFGAATAIPLLDGTTRGSVERAISGLASLIGQVVPPATSKEAVTAVPQFAQQLDDLYATLLWDDEDSLTHDKHESGTPPSASHIERINNALRNHQSGTAGIGAVRLDHSGRYVLAFTHYTTHPLLDTLWDSTEPHPTLVIATDTKHFCYHTQWATEQGPAHQCTTTNAQSLNKLLTNIQLPGCPLPLLASNVTGVFLPASGVGRHQNTCLHVVSAASKPSSSSVSHAVVAAIAAGGSHQHCVVM